ncbi:tyrosine-type recombinase/integrase [Streptomyces luteogriseus]|uniref:tyrosine-type recombinase/integrase n=1 Tax=Streptomyces luteogriseus TaxID=68233 RepID=UPI00379BE01A
MTAQVINLFTREKAGPTLSLAPVPEFTPAVSEDELVDFYLRTFDGRTVPEYSRDIRQYRAFLLDELNVGVYEAEAHHVADWKTYQLDTLEGAKSSVRRRMSSAQGMYRYAMANGWFNRDPFFAVKKPVVGENTQYTGLDLSDVRRLTYHVSRECDLRAKVVILGLLTTGLRVSELLNLDIGDVRPDGGRLKLHVIRKGGKPDVVELPHVVGGMVRELARGRNGGPLLLGAHGKRLARQVAWRIVRSAGDRFLPDHVGRLHPHDARHTFVSGVLLVTGGDLREAQWRASHADMNNTVRYAHALEMAESATVEDLSNTFGICA